MQISASRLDVTEYVCPEWMKEFGVSRVFQIFVFDPNRAVYCCSVRPSTECFPVRHSLEFAAGTTDEQAEAAYESVGEWDGGDVFYLDRPPEILHTSDHDEEYEEAIEAAVELHNANHVL